MADTPNTPESTPVPETRDDSTDQTVTELATVDASDKYADLKAMAGIDGKVEDASEQQQHVYAGLKDAKLDAAGKDRKIVPNEFASGPGSDVA